MNGNTKPKSGHQYIALLNQTPMSSLTFRQLYALKSGQDEYSRLGIGKLMRMVEPDDLRLAQLEFTEHKALAKCLRWRLRGLTIGRAIRKVITDQEVGESARQSRKRRRA